MTFTLLFPFIIDVLMVFMPTVGYIPQYISFWQTGITDGFSLKVPLVLLIANGLRLAFWIESRFALTLVFQSLLLIIVQFALVHAVATIRSRTVIHQKTIYSHLLSSFWDWDDFPSFGLATAVGLVSVFLITFTAIAFPFLFEWIGTAALLIEAMLGLPQVVKNYQRSSTEGFSWFLLGTWILGDAFKTVFFLANNTPYQFVMCGIIQLFVDAVMLAQMLIY